MKAKTKRFISQALSFICDIAISASGLNETIDMKKTVTDFFKYSHLLWLQLRNRLVSALLRMSSRMIKYKVFFAYTLLIRAGAAFLLHFATPAIPVLFATMVIAGALMKNKIREDNFINNTFP